MYQCERWDGPHDRGQIRGRIGHRSSQTAIDPRLCLPERPSDPDLSAQAYPSPNTVEYQSRNVHVNLGLTGVSVQLSTDMKVVQVVPSRLMSHRQAANASTTYGGKPCPI